MSSVPSSDSDPRLSTLDLGVSWATEDFIYAHMAIKNSGRHNFEGCKIPVPTKIRFDRIEAALEGKLSPKEHRTLQLLRYGMPIGCKPGQGVRKIQRNHHSAVNFQNEVSAYFEKGIKSQALIGPFEQSPIPDLCFSPLMSVPKEEVKRRVIVDFPFLPTEPLMIASLLQLT